MKESIISKIEIPKWWKGVTQNHRGLEKNIRLHGYDTETFMGRIFLSGFYSEKGGYQYLYGLKKNHIGFFFDYCENLFHSQRKKDVHIAAAHNLKFDLGVLLWKLLNPMGHALPSPKVSRFCYIPKRAEVFISWRKPCFMRVKFRGGRAIVHFVDTLAFIKAPLRRILSLIGGSDQKKESPDHLGERLIPKAEILPYHRADCVGELRVLEFLYERHKQFDIRFCVSLPQMASRIFRHKFLKSSFVRPNLFLILAALKSYHGGKNSWTGKQGWYKAWDLDIRSAFPHAMLQMPDFTRGNWIKSKKFSKRAGFYLIQGTVSKCPWGVIFSHSFKALSGGISSIWVTSYELEEALRSREIKNLKILDGWIFKEAPGSSGSPFCGFVDHFYRAKEQAKTKIEREFNKLMLNSLYGKFIQRTEEEQNGKFKVGGLFDPCVGSLITGFVRARIHQFEHKYKALHTATDGLITTHRPDSRDIGEELGKLKIETFGDCLILRNKLYLHYNREGNLVKRGLHGYQGSPEELIQMWREKNRYYTVRRLVNWAEGWRLALPPGGPLIRKMELKCLPSPAANV